MKQKVIVIVGPTAVGKTAFAISIAKELNGEIISGDCLQVYKQLDIGTAKPTKEEQAQVLHHLIDIKEMDEHYDAYQFQSEARQLIASITQKGKVPIICGGTGLYIQSLLEDYSFERKAEDEADDRSLYEVQIIGLNTDRESLYERINQRVDKMVERGLLDEARMLFEKYPNAQSTQGIGYKELFPYFRGEIKQDEAVHLIKQHSRNYAKRQITWFKNRMNTQWVDLIKNSNQEEELINQLRKWRYSE